MSDAVTIGDGGIRMVACEPPRPVGSNNLARRLVLAFIASGEPAAKKEFETGEAATAFANRMYRAVSCMGAEALDARCVKRGTTVYLVRGDR